jgi:STE24 endopeptidase
MNQETVFTIIISILFVNYTAERVLSYLNTRNASSQLPEEAKDIYTTEQYSKSQLYLRKKSKFSIVTNTFSFVLLLCMLFFNGFAYVDMMARSVSDSPIIQAFVFFGFIGIGYGVLTIPFSVYSTFVIETRFGFNKMNVSTFIQDTLKGFVLSVILGGFLIGAIVWIYHVTSHWFVPIALILMTVFGIFMTMFYTKLIVPLFNKLTPLGEGELKDAVEEFAKRCDFPLKNISVIDNSKRSTKSNAYFSGFGKKKRIVLFDTLIEKHTTEELVAILAHEIGHYKKKHIQWGFISGMIQTAILLLFLYLFLEYSIFQHSIGVAEPSFHVGVVVFGIIFAPISFLLGIVNNIISRRNEYGADKFAADFGMGFALIDALKKLTSHNLSNLTPHAAFVYAYYSHPPVLQRIKKLKKVN